VLGELLDRLVDPMTHEPLRLDAERGVLLGSASYPVRNGIPRFAGSADAGQQQVGESFGFKWAKRDTFESEASLARAAAWLAERYGFGSVDEMRSWFSGRGSVLDAGCGAGFSASTWLDDGWTGGLYVGVDVSEAVDVALERLGGVPRASFVQADVCRLPFRTGSFDTVFSEGVLHHTPSTRDALREVVRTLAPGGEALFYVYRRKAPIRELADDHLRDRVSAMPAEEAWDELRPLTRLAQALAELGVEVEVPEDVPLLGIAAGTYDVQRLLYWHFAKLFWNSDLSLEENVHVNFDWYHPRYAHRQSEDEVVAWCAEESLTVDHLDVQPSGITVRATKA
jgi:arsenite methyltransferase